jgi:hypothetical protein
MGDGRWEMGSQRLVVEFEAPQKKADTTADPPLHFSSNIPVLRTSGSWAAWLLGCLAPSPRTLT